MIVDALCIPQKLFAALYFRTSRANYEVNGFDERITAVEVEIFSRDTNRPLGWTVEREILCAVRRIDEGK